MSASVTDVYCNLNPLIRCVLYVPHLPDAQACIVMHTLRAGFATFRGRGIMCRPCARQPGSLWSTMVLLMHMPYHSGGEFVKCRETARMWQVCTPGICPYSLHMSGDATYYSVLIHISD